MNESLKDNELHCLYLCLDVVGSVGHPEIDAGELKKKIEGILWDNMKSKESE